MTVEAGIFAAVAVVLVLTEWALVFALRSVVREVTRLRSDLPRLLLLSSLPAVVEWLLMRSERRAGAGKRGRA